MTATLDAPSDSPVNEVGRDRRRKEDAHLITGRTRWTDNIVLPGMLHLALLRSPYAHAKITSISVAGALEASGVVGAWTGADGVDPMEGIEGECEPLDVVLDMEAALAEGATLVHPELGTNQNAVWVF